MPQRFSLTLVARLIPNGFTLCPLFYSVYSVADLFHHAGSVAGPLIVGISYLYIAEPPSYNDAYSGRLRSSLDANWNHF